MVMKINDEKDDKSCYTYLLFSNKSNTVSTVCVRKSDEDSLGVVQTKDDAI